MTDITGLNKDITNNLLIQFEVDIKDKIISPLPYLYILLRILNRTNRIGYPQDYFLRELELPKRNK